MSAPLRCCRLAPATPTQTLEPPSSTSTASFSHPLGNNRHARSSSSRPSLTSTHRLACFSPACNPPQQPPALHLTTHTLQNGRTPPKARHCRRWCLRKNVSVDVSSNSFSAGLCCLPSAATAHATICLSIACFFICHRPSPIGPINSLPRPPHLSCPRRADLNPSVFSKGTFPEVRDSPVLPRRSRIRHLPHPPCPLSRGRLYLAKVNNNNNNNNNSFNSSNSSKHPPPPGHHIPMAAPANKHRPTPRCPQHIIPSRTHKRLSNSS